jgi:hypothetical protein
MRLGALFLANSAEDSNGLLYVLGGGWDSRYIPAGQIPTLVGVLVARLLLDPLDCDRPHALEFRLEGVDGQQHGLIQIANFTVPRPSGRPQGWEVPLNLNIALNATLPALGEYRWAVFADNVLLGTQPFILTEQPPPGGVPRLTAAPQQPGT